MLETQKATGERLSELAQSAQRMIEVGKDISSLQDILQPPKLRGVLGETLLENLLSLYLPRGSFEMQHQFSDGTVIDSVILLPTGKVPIDAKFPLDNFRKMLEAAEDRDRQQCRKEFTKDVVKHIDDISQKYICPDEGTLNFALAYIPAENVYYEIIVKDEDGKSIADYALSKRVIPASPNTFYAHLQSIAIGLKGLRVEKFAQEILATLSRLRGDLDSLQEDYRVLGTHIHNASQKYWDTQKKLTRFEGRLSILEIPAKDTERLEGIEPSSLPPPEKDEAGNNEGNNKS
jgi:DNA recombination protein RmuC